MVMYRRGVMFPQGGDISLLKGIRDGVPLAMILEIAASDRRNDPIKRV